MSLDPSRNFVSCIVSTGYDAAATIIVLASGEGAKLPDPATEGAFNLTWFNWSDFKDPTDDPNVERVRVTARTADTLTIIRGQEGTTATAKNIAGKTYRMTLSWSRINVEQMRNHPLTTKGDIPVFGTAKTRLPVGADGQVLTARAANPLGVGWEVGGGGGGGITSGWELIRTGTFTGNVNITGLDGDADKLWMLIIRTRHIGNYHSFFRFNNDGGMNYWHGNHFAGFQLATVVHGISRTSIEGMFMQDYERSEFLLKYLISSPSGQRRFVRAIDAGFSDVNNWHVVDGFGFWNNTTDNITTINFFITVTLTAGEYWLFRQKT